MSPRIFSQYGENLIVIRSWGSVVYADTPVEIGVTGPFHSVSELFGALDEMTNNGSVIQNLYMTKNKDWESEEEYRILVVFGSPTRPAPEVLVPLSGLKAIVLGMDNVLPKAVETLAAHHLPGQVELLRCDWHLGAPVLRTVD